MENQALITFNAYTDAPWRNISAVVFRGIFDNFWCRCQKPLRVCCLTVNIPELSMTAAKAPLARAIKEIRGGLIDCGVDANFALFRVPKIEKGERSGRFRVLLLVNGNLIQSGEKIRAWFSKELETQLPKQFSLVTLQEPPSFNSDGAMRVDENNRQAALDWIYHYLQDSAYLAAGRTRSVHKSKSKLKNWHAWRNRNRLPRRIYAY